MACQPQLFETNPEPWELDARTEQLVATVVFADAPRGPFDYSVPAELATSLRAGARVKVPLGRGNQRKVGYCVAVGQRSVSRNLKSVHHVLDSPPLIPADMLVLSEWIADYYMCDQGSVLDAVVPAGVRGGAGTHSVTYLSVPTNVAVRLTQLKLPTKQAAALRHLAASPQPLTQAQLAEAVGCTSAPIQALRKKGLLHVEQRREFRSVGETESHESVQPWTLTPDQQRALDAITSALDSAEHHTLLIRGVTGSGKTEVYIQAIEYLIGFGRQAIILVPEISLTPQTVQRFRGRFAEVAVLHSHLSDAERHAEWQRIWRGDVQVVVGARSAVFAPLPHLGLIVIDEEHESTFKQESAPRYHAREVARRRAMTANIPLVLGSATPSLESWHRAQIGTYQLIEIPERVGNRPLPHVSTIDLRDEYRHRAFRGGISRELRRGMEAALSNEGQIILLLNRRGFSTHIQCPACGEVAKCHACDIALTHHRDAERVICHYCDHQEPTMTDCPKCGFTGIRFGGFGTQRLEAEVRALFSEAPLLRMDTDTMRRPGSHEEALSRFRRGEVKILLGTQMIAKGLDFPNVTLVGVINADTALHLPDFRAGERTFQLVTQVAGRTGRGAKGGYVLVQTFNPDHPAIVSATRHDFTGFAAAELPLREQYHYPPFADMIRLIFRGDTESTLAAFAQSIGDQLKQEMNRREISGRVRGPIAAPITKVRGKYRQHLLIQGTGDGTRDVIRSIQGSTRIPDSVQWVVDVDPVSML